MKEHLNANVELFTDNMQMLKGKFIWQNVLLKRLAALLYAARGERINMSALQESYELIKENTKMLSYFRGNSLMSIATLLSFHDDKKKQFAGTLTVYDQMKASKFRASDYLVIAAYQIAGGTDKDQYAVTIERTRVFYDGMKAQHRWITGQNDYIFAAMLGLSDIEIKSGLKQIEMLHRALKPHFRPADGVQALSQVLALGGEGRDMVSRVLDLSDKFRQRGMRLDRAYTLPSLGVLSLLPSSGDTLADEVIEVYELLRTKKGFGRWSVSKQELLLLSSALISYDYADKASNHLLTSALSTSLTNIIIAQQTAIAIMIATSSSAAASSGS